MLAAIFSEGKAVAKETRPPRSGVAWFSQEEEGHRPRWRRVPVFKMAAKRRRCVAEERALFAFYGLTRIKKEQESLCVGRGGALRAIERSKACGRALINTFDDNLLGLFWVR